jgi:hypothetical protein
MDEDEGPPAVVSESAERMRLFSRFRRGSLHSKKPELLRFDFDLFAAILTACKMSFEQQNANLLRLNITRLINLIEPLVILPSDAADSITRFLPKLFDSFLSEDPALISEVISLLCFLVYLSDEIIQALHAQGRYGQLFEFLSHGYESEKLFFLFANAIEDCDVRANFADDLSRIIHQIFLSETDFKLLSSAVCCCYSLSLHAIDLGFLGDLIVPMKSMWANTIELDTIEDTFQYELSMIALHFACANPAHAECVVESGYLSFLLGLLPFVGQSAYVPILELVAHCAKLCPDIAVIQFVDVSQFLSLLKLPDWRVFRAVCSALRILVFRASQYALALLECGFADVLVERIDDLTFPEKSAALGLIIAIMTADTPDEHVAVLLRVPIVEMCREVHEVDPTALPDLYGVLARVHAMSFDNPEVHELVEDLIEC